MKVTFAHLGREHLGIEYLSSMLKKNAHQTSLVYDPGLFGSEDNVFYIPALEKFFDQKKKVIADIERLHPHILAFSAYTSNYQWACSVARRIKQTMDVKIVFGGVHATLVPDTVIKNDFVDFVVIGEGEYAMLELVEAIASGKSDYRIQNVWHKKGGRVVKNPLRPLLCNLDELPLPDKALFEKEVNFSDDYNIMTGRGCVFRCSYCCESFYTSLYKRKFYRRRSVRSIIDELTVMKRRYNFKEVMFDDAIFFTDKKWLRELLHRYKKEIGVRFRCFGNVFFFNKEIGMLIKDAGCYCIQFGMQTVNELIKQNVLNRHEKNERALEVFNLCDKLKLRYDIDHMFGLPRETIEDHIHAVMFYSHLCNYNRIKCHNLTYFPKLDILKCAREEGILNDEKIKEIETGKIGDFFHSDTAANKMMENVNQNFKIFYKILPLLPKPFVRFILKHKIYTAFRHTPSILVIFLQIAVAFKGKDYRYILYCKYYFLRIKRLILG